MTEHPSVDARQLVDDDRYPAYKASLEEKRNKIDQHLRRHQDLLLHAKPVDVALMCRMAGEIAGIEFALGLPSVLLASDPTSDNPNLPTP